MISALSYLLLSSAQGTYGALAGNDITIEENIRYNPSGGTFKTEPIGKENYLFKISPLDGSYIKLS